MPLSKSIYSFQNKTFNYVIMASYFLYAAVIIGLFAKAPQYLSTLQTYISIYVCLFLIIRFNPFNKVKFNALDKKIAFSAGIYILTTTAITKLATDYLKEIQSFFNKMV